MTSYGATRLGETWHGRHLILGAPMILKSEESVRRLFAAHNLTIHSLRHGKHWVVRASRNGGPIVRIIISHGAKTHVLRKIENDLRRVR
jgi:hypothetical protein